MSEPEREPENEPSLEPLSRFTPDPGLLDRDALLFAAGRRSARPARGWLTLAALLAMTQTLTLGLLSRPGSGPSGVVGHAVAIAPRPTAHEPPAAVNPAFRSERRRLLEAPLERRSAPDFTLGDPGPPLRAFPRPARLLN